MPTHLLNDTQRRTPQHKGMRLSGACARRKPALRPRAARAAAVVTCIGRGTAGARRRPSFIRLPACIAVRRRPSLVRLPTCSAVRRAKVHGRGCIVERAAGGPLSGRRLRIGGRAPAARRRRRGPAPREHVVQRLRHGRRQERRPGGQGVRRRVAAVRLRAGAGQYQVPPGESGPAAPRQCSSLRVLRRLLLPSRTKVQVHGT